MREISKYTKAYLETNAKRGLGNGLTVSTYVSKYCPVGCGGRYAGTYTARIYYDLMMECNVFEFLSARNGKAYYPKSMLKSKGLRKKLKLANALIKMNPKIEAKNVRKLLV